MDNLVRLFFINTMGEAILVETLRAAAYFVMRSGGTYTHRPETITRFKESKHCYFFIQSTALDILIQTYDLAYDPDELRDEFHYLISHSSNHIAYARKSA